MTKTATAESTATKARKASGKVVMTTASAMPDMPTAEKLMADIDKLHKDAGSLTQRYQVLGTQALMLFGKANNIGPINRLMAKFPAGLNRNGFGQWLMAYGALQVSQNMANRKEMPLEYAKGKTTDPEGAWAHPWTEFNPPKPLDDTFDLQKAFHGLLTRAKGKKVTLGGKTLSESEAIKTLRIVADLAGEEDYVPDVKQPQSLGRRVDDVEGKDVTPAAAIQDADKPKATKADPKRLAAAS